MITKSAILISAQFHISPHYCDSFMSKINHCVAMSYHCHLPVGFCILVVYCKTVLSAIPATAWLLVISVLRLCCPTHNTA